MKVKNSGFSRRAMLRGAGGIIIGLPLLEFFGCNSPSLLGGDGIERTQQNLAEPPKRIVFLITWNGTNPRDHWPTGSETNFTLGPIMKPLEAYKKNMIVFRGIDNKAGIATGINGHTDGTRCMLTGRKAANNSNTDYTAGGGPSVDQVIANQIGSDVKFKSLQYILPYQYQDTDTTQWRPSYYSAKQQVPYEADPVQFFNDVFSGVKGGTGPDPALLKLQADRKSVLDAVTGQYSYLNNQLGSADRQRLAEHLDRVRDLEKRVTGTTSASATCTVPQKPGDSQENDPVNVGVDLLAYAIGCDLTRVGAISHANYAFDFIGVPKGAKYHDDWLHHVAETGSVGDQARKWVNVVKTWEAQQVANFLDRLKSIPEGNGTAFDNTLVVWSDEFCHGYDHLLNEIPYTLFSGSNRFFQMGRYIQYPNAKSSNELWLALMKTMGATGAFGDPQFGSTPLAI